MTPVVIGPPCVVCVGVAFILGWRMFLRSVKDCGFAFLQLIGSFTWTTARVPRTKILCGMRLPCVCGLIELRYFD